MTISPSSRKKGRRLRRRSIVLIAMGVVVAVISTIVIAVVVNLPDDLEIGRLSQKSNLYATTSAGTPYLLAAFYDQNRVEVAFDAISPFGLL